MPSSFTPPTAARTLSRRDLMRAGAGATVATMLAGTAATVTAAQEGAVLHGAWPYQTPPVGHFNSFVTNGILNPPNIWGDLITLPMGLYYWASQEWLPVLATEWGFAEGDRFTITLRDDVAWSDGTPFTSKDVVATLWCLRILSNTVWEYIDEVEAPDDYSVSVHMKQPSTVVERYMIRLSPRPASVYGAWMDEAKTLFESGKTIEDPEGTQLIDRFSKFMPETVLGNGPYLLDTGSITNSEMTLVKNPDGHLADQAAFDAIRLFNGETDTISALVLSKDVDYATHAFAPATEQEMLNSGIRVLRPPTFAGQALLINYGRLGAAFNDKRARQALAHAIDRSQNGYVAMADSGRPVQHMAGFSDQLLPQWVEEAQVAELNPYEYDPEKAAALLQEAGWTRDGDRWKTPDGTDASWEIIFPAELANQSASGQDVAEQLTDFGIELTPRGVTFTQQPIDIAKGAFDFAINFWGNSSFPHPHYAFVADLFTINYPGAINQGGRGIDFPLTQETDVLGTVDLEQMVVASAEGLDAEAQKAHIASLAAAFNELLPIIPLYERLGNNAALEGVRVEAWPADDDPLLQNSPYADGIPTLLLLTGKLQPVSGA